MKENQQFECILNEIQHFVDIFERREAVAHHEGSWEKTIFFRPSHHINASQKMYRVDPGPECWPFAKELDESIARLSNMYDEMHICPHVKSVNVNLFIRLDPMRFRIQFYFGIICWISFGNKRGQSSNRNSRINYIKMRSKWKHNSCWRNETNQNIYKFR